MEIREREKERENMAEQNLPGCVPPANAHQSAQNESHRSSASPAD